MLPVISLLLSIISVYYSMQAYLRYRQYLLENEPEFLKKYHPLYRVEMFFMNMFSRKEKRRS